MTEDNKPRPYWVDLSNEKLIEARDEYLDIIMDINNELRNRGVLDNIHKCHTTINLLLDLIETTMGL